MVKVHGGMAFIAVKANLNRENLYQVLSKKGNSEMESVCLLLHATGLKLPIEAELPQGA